jgi:hypothetical protein
MNQENSTKGVERLFYFVGIFGILGYGLGSFLLVGLDPKYTLFTNYYVLAIYILLLSFIFTAFCLRYRERWIYTLGIGQTIIIILGVLTTLIRSVVSFFPYPAEGSILTLILGGLILKSGLTSLITLYRLRAAR